MLWRISGSIVFYILHANGELNKGPAPPEPPPPCDSSLIEVAEECPGDAFPGFPWTSYLDELYAARSEIFSKGTGSAVAKVRALLGKATETFSDTFGCLPALISSYFTMARLMAFQGRLRRALAFLQMGFVFVRDKGFSECTSWPVQGWDMMLAGRSLVERLRVLDDESVTKGVPADHREPGLRIAIVTICAYAPDETVRVMCQENRALYSSLHGYDVHFFTDASEIMPDADAGMDVEDGMHKAFFWKVSAVKNVMSAGAYDWVLWMDCDAFFMDPRRTIDSVIAKYALNATPATRLPPHHADELGSLSELRRLSNPDIPVPVSLILAVDSTGINNGVWMLRDTPWAHDFLHSWWHSDILSGPGHNHNCSDQSTMQHTLLHNRVMSLDAALDSIEAPIWPPEVRVAAQEDLQSFHQATAETAMSRAWEEGDFIKHHPGCHYYRPPCQYLYEEAETIFRNKVLSIRTLTGLG